LQRYFALAALYVVVYDLLKPYLVVMGNDTLMKMFFIKLAYKDLSCGLFDLHREPSAFLYQPSYLWAAEKF
jgi:hypothetical protein